MNVIEIEIEHQRKPPMMLGTRIEWYADRVYYNAPPENEEDIPGAYIYTREEYLDGIMEWA